MLRFLPQESPTTHNKFSGTYAKTYDIMYRDKDYEAECDFLEDMFRCYTGGAVQSVLDLGGGTGGHALLLARRGYQVWGVDCSTTMIAIAREKAQARELATSTRFEVADICALEFFLEQTGFAMEHLCPFMELDGRLDTHTWNVAMIARANREA